IRLGAKRPSLLVAIDSVPELAGVKVLEDGSLRIGAATTMAAIARDPAVMERMGALSDAAGWMGSPQVRNRASIGGNLCNARPCADTAPPSIVGGAVLELRSVRGTRKVPADGFMTGPGQTVRNPDELCVAVVFPPSGRPAGSAFFTCTNRKAVEITITSAAAWIELENDGGPIASARVALGSVAPTPVRAPSAEAALVGRTPGNKVFAEAAAEAVRDARPIDDLRAGAQYRRWMVEVMVRRALERAFERANGGARP
ncbi:MAG: xanthine dehydrogenase family protein subunit M, partial [Deltaproteobacteria bacterium]